jgi:hypothetical protein
LPNSSGRSDVLEFEGEAIVTINDLSTGTKQVIFLDPTGQVVVADLVAQSQRILDDDLQLSELLSGADYQKAMLTLRDLRAQRG